MGLFDFFRSEKKDEPKDTLEQMIVKYFPNGEKDIDAVTEVLLDILDTNVNSRDEVKDIAVKSVVISRITKGFNPKELKQYLADNSTKDFNDKQIKTFYGYLAYLTAAYKMFKTAPVEVVRDGESWDILE